MIRGVFRTVVEALGGTQALLVHGARPLAIVGHVEWRPISAHHEAEESRIGLLLAAAAAPLLLGTLLFWRLKR